MIKPDYSRFNSSSKTVAAKNSKEGWREFLVAVSYFTNECSFRMKEAEIIDITKSLHNWTTRKDQTHFRDKLGNSDIGVGEIFSADLGLSYETAYVHPVIVMEIIGNKLLVVPVTSSEDKFKDAYHPVSNKKGNKMMRRVYEADGFEVDCSIMLNSIMVINKGRLINRKSLLVGDINKESSLFNQIKDSLFEIYMGKYWHEMKQLKQENFDLKEKIFELEQQLSKQQEVKPEQEKNISSDQENVKLINTKDL